MLERFTSDARDVVVGARENALRLGHRWIGCEHLLLALAATDGQAGIILRGHGVTPERVRAEVVRLAGPAAGSACSTSWTPMRSPPSASISTPSGARSRRPSGRMP